MQAIAWLLPASVLLAAQTCEPPSPEKTPSEKSEKESEKGDEIQKKKDVKAAVAEGDSNETDTDSADKDDNESEPVKPLKVPIEIDGLPGQLAQIPGTNIVLTTPYGVDISKNGIKLNEGKNFWLTFGPSDTGLHVVFQNDGPLACFASTARTYSPSQLTLMQKSCETMREVTPK